VSLLTNPTARRSAALLHRLGLESVNRRIKRLIERSGRDTITVNADGLTLSGPISGWRTLSQIEQGTYESDEIALFRRALRPGSTVVDVGAHVGYYALVAAQAVQPDGRVFAFEPDPRTRPFIEANAVLNGLDNNITVIGAAATDGASRRDMYLSANANRSSLHPSATLDGLARMETVETVSVDEILDGRGADVVKIDAEGSEPAVLRGMARSLHPATVVFMEFNPPVLASAGEDPAAFGRWLVDRFELVQRVEGETQQAIEALPLEFVNLRLTGWRGETDAP
jgi:FkbM family methyltransferase